MDVSWPLPNFNRSHKLWSLASACVMPTVGVFSKLLASYLNTLHVYNREALTNALDHRAKSKPLLTVSNHHSCMDDPLLWGCLDVRHYRAKRMRWSLGAHDICFTRELHALFFSLGRTVPVIRGHGVYQKAMDFVVNRLNRGEWVHIFPEGKVNMNKSFVRFKWGIGRLVSDAEQCPTIIPIYHIGMDDVLPNGPPYIPKIGKTVTIVVGKPLELDSMVEELKNRKKSAMEQRKIITDTVQNAMKKLEREAKALHKSNTSPV